MTTTTAMRQGTIKSLKRVEGYGFISDPATGVDYFFHRSTLENPQADWEEMMEFDLVEFQPIETPRGWRAAAVRVLSRE